MRVSSLLVVVGSLGIASLLTGCTRNGLDDTDPFDDASGVCVEVDKDGNEVEVPCLKEQGDAPPAACLPPNKCQGVPAWE